MRKEKMEETRTKQNETKHNHTKEEEMENKIRETSKPNIKKWTRRKEEL